MSVDGARHSVSFGEAPAWPLVAFTVQLVAGIRYRWPMAPTRGSRETLGRFYAGQWGRVDSAD